MGLQPSSLFLVTRIEMLLRPLLSLFILAIVLYGCGKDPEFPDPKSPENPCKDYACAQDEYYPVADSVVAQLHYADGNTWTFLDHNLDTHEFILKSEVKTTVTELHVLNCGPGGQCSGDVTYVSEQFEARLHCPTLSWASNYGDDSLLGPADFLITFRDEGRMQVWNPFMRERYFPPIMGDDPNLIFHKNFRYIGMDYEDVYERRSEDGSLYMRSDYFLVGFRIADSSGEKGYALLE